MATAPDTERRSGISEAGLDLRFAAGVTLVSFIIMMMYHPWEQAAQGDMAIFQVFGRLINDGKVPYRDFFDHKTPLVSYLDAFIALLSGWFHFDYILGARGLSVACFSFGGGLLFLMARDAGLERAPSVLAGCLLLALDIFPWSGAIGLEAKAFIVFLGMGALLAAFRNRWVVSGALCGLAVLAWQPALAYLVGVAARALLSTGGAQRRQALTAILASFAAPIIVLLVYLLAAGAFGDFWADTVTFNREYVGHPSWPYAVDVMARVINQSYSSDRWLFLVATVGFAGWFAVLADGLRQRSLSSELRTQLPFVVTTLAVLAHSAINATSGGDIFPFVPWLALWIAWLVHELTKRGASISAHAHELGLIAIAGLLVYGHHTLVQTTALQQPPVPLSWQRDQVAKIEESAALKDDDPIFAMNAAWFVLLADREPLGKYLYNWSGVVRFSKERDGKNALSRPIASERPKLVVLGDGAETTLVGADADRYLQIDQRSLPGIFFDTAQYWLRSDLPLAGATAEVMLPIPARPSTELCAPADAGNGYRAMRLPEAGWRDVPGQQQYRAQLVGAPSDPDVTCAAAIFDRAAAATSWMELARSGVCRGCRQLPPPTLGDDTLLIAGSRVAGLSGGYGAQVVATRGFVFVNALVYLPNGTPNDEPRLVGIATSLAQKMLSRFQ